MGPHQYVSPTTDISYLYNYLIIDFKKKISSLEENLEADRQTITDNKKEIESKNQKIETLKKVSIVLISYIY